MSGEYTKEESDSINELALKISKFCDKNNANIILSALTLVLAKCLHQCGKVDCLEQNLSTIMDNIRKTIKIAKINEFLEEEDDSQ